MNVKQWSRLMNSDDFFWRRAEEGGGGCRKLIKVVNCYQGYLILLSVDEINICYTNQQVSILYPHEELLNFNARDR